MAVDQAFVCGGGLPGRYQNRSPDAGSYFIVHWGVHSADRRLHAILPELYVIDDDDSGWKTRHVSGKTGCGAVSGDNAATGSVAACAGCGCGNRHDRDRLASGRTSRDGRLDRRLSLFPDLRRAFDLQPVFAAASSGVLDDGNERHRGSDGGSVGLQQHAAAHLRQVDAAYRNVSVAVVCHHELSGAVFDGRVVCSDGSLGRRCTDRILFDRTGGVESGGEELYIGKHVRSRVVEYAGECVRHLAVESDESASRSRSRRRATENDTSTEYVKSQKTGAASPWIRSDCTVWFMTK